MPELKVLSLGWGIQSWTLAAMSALGELPKIDFAIHSDTTWEHTYTYEFASVWGPWLEDHGIKYVCVSDEGQAAKVDTSGIFISAFSRDESNVIDNHGGVSLPAHTTTGTKTNGQLRRQCTQRWKIQPMRKWLSGELARRSLKKTPGVIEQWLGISTDEWKRVKDSDVKYIVNKYPLLDLRMSRGDCLNWLEGKGLPSPGKSACVFCPYKNRIKWAELKRNGGKDWDTAIRVDEAIRDKRPPYPLYVHPDRIPLVEAVVIPEDYGREQLSLLPGFDDDDAECDSGYCFL